MRLATSKGLFVRHGSNRDDLSKGRRWGVHVPSIRGHGWAVWGYARRADAEMARAALSELDVDWTVESVKEMRRQLGRLGIDSHQDRLKVAAKYLQW